ncbi:MAG: hypothetical protein F9K29_03385 [Hyphomicrobiaceae bacterium]|nr:MAG: hypothetical protein F9K29_03385 [Hyphomicrobiaceae bacterium]
MTTYADAIAAINNLLYTGGKGRITPEKLKEVILGLAGVLVAQETFDAMLGAADGIATLGPDAKVPSAQLPSFVDDVVEYANTGAFPATGSTGLIYVALDTNKTYRWSGSTYVEISASPGTTDALTEGATNLYFTNGRADARIAAAIGATVQAYLGYTPVNKAGDTMTGALTLSGDGANPLHAVTKQQLDAALYGLDGKESVRAASTANVDIASAPAALDGVTLAAGDRVLLKDQTAPAENGIRVFTAAGAALARAADMDAWSEVPGAFVAVEEGTANADTTWLCTANKGGTLDTSSISFTQANSPSSGVSSFNGRNGAVLPADDDYAVTQLAAIGAGTFVGNSGGAPARPVIMTVAQAKTLLNYVFADIGSKPTTLAGYGITDAGSVLLAQGTLANAATLDIVLPSGYRGFVVHLAAFRPMTDGVDLYCRFSTDGGASFDASGYNYAVQGVNDTPGALTTGSGSAAQILLSMPAANNQIGNDAAEGWYGMITLLDPANAAAWSRILFDGAYVSNYTTPQTISIRGSGQREATQNTDALRFLFSADNIADGKYALYGLL